jgi:hypothetical protein
MKKIIYIVLTLILAGSPLFEVFSQREEFGKKKIGRETISRDDRDARNGDARKAGPPGPGGGGEGDPIPVNGGLLLLLGMSTTYFLVQRKKLNSK